MSFYTRKQLMEILEIDEGFLISIEREEIISDDAPESEVGHYSERMLERARVAQSLVSDLEVNLPGVAVILRMREDMAAMRHRVEELVIEIQKKSGR